MTSRDRSLQILGPPGVGKDMLTGSMLFNYGGIDLKMMQEFQEENIHTYDEASKKLKSLPIPPTFYTRSNYHVTILGGHSPEADCTILVLTPETSLHMEQSQQLSNGVRGAKQLIVLINKMDAFGWSEEQFREAVRKSTAYLESNGIDTTKVPIIPVSAIKGENLLEKSLKCPWYSGWVKDGLGTTLLEALDVSFRS